MPKAPGGAQYESQFMKIAIIGSGIAGNSAAWALSRSGYDVTLFEARNRPGGHAATVDVDYDGRKISVDTGFIVYNEPNYPDLVGLFDHLNIETINSIMSFALSRPGRFWRQEWNLSDVKAALFSGLNLLNPSFIPLVREIFRFSKQSMVDLRAGALRGLTLEEYCKQYHPRLARDFLIPMGAAILSTPGGDFGQFPAESFVRFFANHKILDWDAPMWKTVKGGSRTYVHRMMETLVGRVRFGARVASVRRVGSQVLKK